MGLVNGEREVWPEFQNIIDLNAEVCRRHARELRRERWRSVGMLVCVGLCGAAVGVGLACWFFS
jgi:hypothetical protein